MNVIPLTPMDLALAAVFVFLLGILSNRLKLDVERALLIGALRTTVQLVLTGFVLTYVFKQSHPLLVAGISLIMLGAAGWEIYARQNKQHRRYNLITIGASSLFISSFSVTSITLIVIIGNTPWYLPQYAIPLLGMVLGNTMTGIALGTNHFGEQIYKQQKLIEQRLALGHSRHQAISELRRESMRTGMIPMINALATVGLVSLPGMMTGQILAGSAPLEAVKYQIVIMFLIAASTGFGTVVALYWYSGSFFDERERLRLTDRIKSKN